MNVLLFGVLLFWNSSFVSKVNLDPITCILTTVFSIDFSSVSTFLSSHVILLRSLMRFLSSNTCVCIVSMNVSRCLFLVSLGLQNLLLLCLLFWTRPLSLLLSLMLLLLLLVLIFFAFTVFLSLFLQILTKIQLVYYNH